MNSCLSPVSSTLTLRGLNNGVNTFKGNRAQKGNSLAMDVVTNEGWECANEIPGFRDANSLTMREFIVML
jgi:hypothetical protein